uniref:Uncharacterized protein n=1 Tax=Oryza glumipatula TaxID=40148 RepID=A0A0E0ANR3_9ORYZ
MAAAAMPSRAGVWRLLWRQRRKARSARRSWAWSWQQKSRWSAGRRSQSTDPASFPLDHHARAPPCHGSCATYGRNSGTAHPTSCRSASASLSTALRIAAAAAAVGGGLLGCFARCPRRGIREERNEMSRSTPGVGRVGGGGGGESADVVGWTVVVVVVRRRNAAGLSRSGDALEGGGDGEAAASIAAADSFAPVFSGFASRRAAAVAVAWRGVPRWLCWGVGATARGGYLRRGLGGRVVRRFWVGIKRRRRILEEAPARRKGDAWWRDSSRLVFGLAPRRGEL